MKPGTVEKSSDGAVLTSGNPVRVYSVTWISGGTAGNIELRDGTSASDTLYTSEAGTANRSKTLSFEGGLLFANGCFYDHDSNTTLAVISCQEEPS